MKIPISSGIYPECRQKRMGYELDKGWKKPEGNYELYDINRVKMEELTPETRDEFIYRNC
jgi:hypothetical protein